VSGKHLHRTPHLRKETLLRKNPRRHFHRNSMLMSNLSKSWLQDMRDSRHRRNDFFKVLFSMLSLNFCYYRKILSSRVLNLTIRFISLKEYNKKNLNFRFLWSLRVQNWYKNKEPTSESDVRHNQKPSFFDLRWEEVRCLLVDLVFLKCWLNLEEVFSAW